MAQLSSSQINKVFGEVNTTPLPNGRIAVKATILVRPKQVEHAQTGLAIDGSKSMQEEYGCSDFFDDDNPFAGLGGNNNVEPYARQMASFLSTFDSDGGTETIYFACGKFGKEIEPIGDLTAETAPLTPIPGPKNWGTGTCIVPAMQHFLKLYENSPWLLAVIITDGLINDLEEAKVLSNLICLEMSAGIRGFTKFVIVGIGPEFNKEDSPARKALETLDDLDDDPVYGVPGQDLWDHKVAKDMRSLNQIFAEVVSVNTIISPTAVVLDSFGTPVEPENGVEYERGLPALLTFTMPANSTGFSILLPNGNVIQQNII